jgi:hypothetical protein
MMMHVLWVLDYANQVNTMHTESSLLGSMIFSVETHWDITFITASLARHSQPTAALKDASVVYSKSTEEQHREEVAADRFGNLVFFPPML